VKTTKDPPYGFCRRRPRVHKRAFSAVMLAVCAVSIAGAGLKAVDKAEKHNGTAKGAVQENAIAAAEADDSYRYYPATIGNILYIKISKKSEPGRQLFVKVQVVRIEKKEEVEYYYFFSPKVNVRYLMGIDKRDGVYMGLIKYPIPLFGFSVDVNIKPKMRILRFPLKAGDKWHYEGKARAHLFFMPVTRDIKADFEVVERVPMKTAAGDIDTYHLKVVLELGDGKGATTEHYWYGKDIGYSVADTSDYCAEIAGYSIFNEQEGRWIEKLPETPEKYE